MVKAFAIDLGNGQVKARSEKRILIAPSMIANEKALGVGSVSNLEGEHDYNLYESKLKIGKKYVWGRDIKERIAHSDLMPTYTHHKRYESANFRLLFEFVLAELASDFNKKSIEVVLVASLPSDEVRTDVDKDLKSFLKGTHVITRNGSELVIDVVDVTINEQPLGTLLSENMNDKKQINKNVQTKTYTVFDFGAGTSIIDTYRGLKRIPELSDVLKTGQNDIYKQIATALKHDSGLSDVQYSQIEDGFRRGDHTAKISDRVHPSFGHLVDGPIDDFCEAVITKLNTIIPNRDIIDGFYITGGGANIVGDAFKSALQEHDATIEAAEPQLANLKGHYNLAILKRDQIHSMRKDEVAATKE
ncbi:hypothetical protein ABC345_21050 [Shouchella sp. 1P09AA]|uniref:ParM/StbA family protein n=1 Tax=unclassified Shouchella TaxID=2893065 RepID=UPI00399F84FE